MKTLFEMENECQNKMLELGEKIAVKEEEIRQINLYRNNSGKYEYRKVQPEYIVKQRCYLESMRLERTRLGNRVADIRRQLKQGGQRSMSNYFLDVAKLVLPQDKYDFILNAAIELSKNGGRAEELLALQKEK